MGTCIRKKTPNDDDKIAIASFKSSNTDFIMNKALGAQENLSVAISKSPMSEMKRAKSPGRWHRVENRTVPECHPNNNELLKETEGFMKLQHDENITLPETVAHLAEQPLCRIVATWGLLQNHYLNRQRIMQAFNVSRRKAGYILRYIVHSPCITCDQHVYTHPRSHRQELRVWIRTVSQPQPLRTKCTRVHSEDRQNVWAQLLQRPWSELHL